MANKIITPYILGVTLSIIFLILMPNFANNGVLDTNTCFTVAIYSLLLLTYQVITFRYMMPRHSVLIVVFLVLSYLFNLSQIVLFGFDYQISDTLLSLSVLNSSYSGEAVTVAFHSLIGVFIGILSYYFFKKPDNMEKKKKTYNTNLFIPLAFIIGILCDIFNNVITVLTFGYANIESSPILFVTRILSLFLLSAVVLYILNDKYTIKAKRTMLIIFVIFKLLCMLTGYRAYALISILLVTYVYFRYCTELKIKKKHFFLGIILVQILSSVLVSVRDMRQTSIDAAKVLETVFSFDKSIVFDMLAEFGITLNVLSKVINEMHGIGTGGGQLFTSIVSVVPGARNFFPDINFADQNMDEYLGIHGIGGSYIGDLVFDFGTNYIIIASIFAGIFFTYIFDKFEISLKNKDYIKASFWAPLIVEIIFCVRSSTYKLPRQIIWYFVIFTAIRIVTGCFREKRINNGF